ncbi:HAD-IC family P-type ATPase [Candidatus Chlorohelix sp.]|uniref:HAD-IC family P-type ATPase n=1 Tax=Candidatus Chlorohelix sp. TaxID=3139201 RepID=UPI0030391E07
MDIPAQSPVSTLGLSEAEVEIRRKNGLGNNVKIQTSRTYDQIIRENVFTFINNIIFIIGALLLFVGLINDAIVSVSVILINVIVNVIQEINAKRKLDRISLLTRPKATVLRSGQQKNIDPSEIVIGDVLLLTPGDQIVVDGRMVGEGTLEVDESQLTGESDLIKKRAGDKVYSGSFCVTGSAAYETEKVGGDSLANQITAGAKAFRRVLTPLQIEVNLVIKILIILVALFTIILIAQTILLELPLMDSVRVAAVLAGLVPNGLFMMIALAYAIGAVRIAGKGALIQQANAVESLSNVDILCLDKTGTLTSNQIQLHSLFPLEVSETELKRIAGIYAASTPAGNKTNEAIKTGCGGSPYPFLEHVPFSSERKWSALAFEQSELRGVYALGAPENLTASVSITTEIQYLIDTGTEQGLRVLLLAYSPHLCPLFENGSPVLPSLIPLGVLWFHDILRAEAKETLAAFAAEGIQVKIISGDNPQTVAALAIQAGLPTSIKTISGPELDNLSQSQLSDIAEETTIFGRIRPQQKEILVSALRSHGHYVAMIGDGVNDVLSLKKANLGIAMESGSQATRSVADVVLLGDSFAALPHAFREGNRIRNGMQDILKLFLVRVLFVTLLIIYTGLILGIEFFPFTPTQSSIFVLLTVGIPVFGLALWAPSGTSQRGSTIFPLLHYVIPACFMLSLASLAIYIGYCYFQLESIAGDFQLLDVIKSVVPVAQSGLVTFTLYCGLLLVIFAQPPLKIFVGGDRLSGDWRPTILAGAILVAYFVIILVDPLRKIFNLQVLPWVDYLMLGGLAVLWAVIMQIIWRYKLLDRFLKVDLKGPTKTDWQ